MERAVFFVSDSTGITVEMLGRSVLAQFEHARFAQDTLPFVDNADKAAATAQKIAAAGGDARPIVFHTFADKALAAVVRESVDALFVDCLADFIRPLERELKISASHSSGRSHTMDDIGAYHRRIEALNFTIAHDDGASLRRLADAELILLGVSRCGKTPTSFYLAMHFGVAVANYPLVPEDLERDELPAHLRPWREKLFALTIAPDRLAQIRAARRPHGEYASPANCARELRQAAAIFAAEKIKCIDTTSRSVEELAAKILQESGVARHPV